MPPNRRGVRKRPKDNKRAEEPAGSKRPKTNKNAEDQAQDPVKLEALLRAHELGVVRVGLDDLQLAAGRTRPHSEPRLRRARQFLTGARCWQRTSPAVATFQGTEEEEQRFHKEMREKLTQTGSELGVPDVSVLEIAPAGLSVNEGFHRLAVLRELRDEETEAGGEDLTWRDIRINTRILKRDTPLDVQRKIGDLMNLDHDLGETNTFVDVCWRLNELLTSEGKKDEQIVELVELDPSLRPHAKYIIRFVKMLGPDNIRTLEELQNYDHQLIWDLHCSRTSEKDAVVEEGRNFESKCFLEPPRSRTGKRKYASAVNRPGLTKASLPHSKEALVHCWGKWVLSAGTVGMTNSDWTNWCSRTTAEASLPPDVVQDHNVREQFENHVSDMAVVDAIHAEFSEGGNLEQVCPSSPDDTPATVKTYLALMRAYAAFADVPHRDLLQRLIDDLAEAFPDKEFATEGTAITGQVSRKTYLLMESGQREAHAATENLRQCINDVEVAAKASADRTNNAKQQVHVAALARGRTGVGWHADVLAFLNEYPGEKTTKRKGPRATSTTELENEWCAPFMRARLKYQQHESYIASQEQKCNSALDEKGSFVNLSKLARQTALPDQSDAQEETTPSMAELTEIQSRMSAAYKNGDKQKGASLLKYAKAILDAKRALDRHAEELAVRQAADNARKEARRDYLAQLAVLDLFGLVVPSFSSEDQWRQTDPEELKKDVKDAIKGARTLLANSDEHDTHRLLPRVEEAKLSAEYLGKGFVHDRWDAEWELTGGWDYGYAGDLVPAVLCHYPEGAPFCMYALPESMWAANDPGPTPCGCVSLKDPLAHLHHTHDAGSHRENRENMRRSVIPERNVLCILRAQSGR